MQCQQFGIQGSKIPRIPWKSENAGSKIPRIPPQNEKAGSKIPRISRQNLKYWVQDPSRSQILDTTDPESRIFLGAWHNPGRYTIITYRLSLIAWYYFLKNSLHFKSAFPSYIYEITYFFSGMLWLHLILSTASWQSVPRMPLSPSYAMKQRFASFTNIAGIINSKHLCFQSSMIHFCVKFSDNIIL